MTDAFRLQVAGVVIAQALLLVACSQETDSQVMASARSNIAKRNNTAAVVQLKGLLQKNPNSGEGRFMMGRVLLEQGLAPEARIEFERAKALKYDDNLVVPQLARVLLATRQPKKLLSDFDGLTLQSADAQGELHTARALAHAQLQNPSQMVDELERALKVAPKLAWALRTKARIAAANGKFEDALAVVDEAILIDPGSGDGWMLKGAVLSNLKKDKAEVIAAYQKAVLDPKVAVAGHLAAISLLLDDGKLAQARTQFAELKKSHPGSVYTAYAQAQLAFQEKDYVKTKELLQVLVSNYPNSPQLLYFLGLADKHRGAYLSAVTSIGKAVQLAPEMTDARKALVETYLQLGQTQQAQSMLRPLLEAAGPDSETLVLAAGVQLQLGQVQQAEALYMRADKAKPNDANIQTALALADMSRGNFEAGFAKLQRASASDSGVVADMAIVAARMKRKEFDVVLGDLDRLEKKDPALVMAKFLRGVVHRQRADTKAAREAFESALKVQPNHFASVENLVAIDVGEQQLDAAQKRIEEFIKRTPQVGAAYVVLADLLARQGAKPGPIIEVLNEAIRANPTDALSRRALLAILQDSKDVKQGLSAAQAAIAAMPEDPEVLYSAALAQSAAGDDQQAISTLTKLISIQPKSPLPHLRLSDLYLRRRDEAAAALSSRRAFDVAPESPAVQRNLIMMLQRSGDSTVALAAARDLQKRAPRRGSGYLFEGDIHTLQKKWSAAESAYRQALSKEGSTDLAAISVYMTIAAAGKSAEAERFASDWIKAHPKDVTFQNRRAELAMTNKDFAGAERRFMDVIALDPAHASALNNLAWLNIERNSVAALGYAERAAKVLPADASIQDTLALALAARGQLEKAIAAQLRAIALKPGAPAFRLALAKLYIKAGDKDKARIELEALGALGAKFGGQGDVAALRKSLL